MNCVASMWILDIQTLFLVLAQLALYWRSHLQGPTHWLELVNNISLCRCTTKKFPFVYLLLKFLYCEMGLKGLLVHCKVFVEIDNCYIPHTTKHPGPPSLAFHCCCSSCCLLLLLWLWESWGVFQHYSGTDWGVFILQWTECQTRSSGLRTWG